MNFLWRRGSKQESRKKMLGWGNNTTGLLGTCPQHTTQQNRTCGGTKILLNPYAPPTNTPATGSKRDHGTQASFIPQSPSSFRPTASPHASLITSTTDTPVHKQACTAHAYFVLSDCRDQSNLLLFGGTRSCRDRLCSARRLFVLYAW